MTPYKPTTTTIIIALLPFLIELFVDWYYIAKLKKPDPIRLKHRAALITGITLLLIVVNSFPSWRWIAMVLIVACLPYCFFDNVLSWFRGKRGLDYKGQTKNWDKWYTNFNPYAVMTVRILVALVLGYLYIRL